MKLWPQIIKQLEAEAPEVRTGTAWVCGTAVQNNPEAQQAVSSSAFRRGLHVKLMLYLVFEEWWFRASFKIDSR